MHEVLCNNIVAIAYSSSHKVPLEDENVNQLELLSGIRPCFFAP